MSSQPAEVSGQLDCIFGGVHLSANDVSELLWQSLYHELKPIPG